MSGSRQQLTEISGICGSEAGRGAAPAQVSRAGTVITTQMLPSTFSQSFYLHTTSTCDVEVVVILYLKQFSNVNICLLFRTFKPFASFDVHVFYLCSNVIGSVIYIWRLNAIFTSRRMSTVWPVSRERRNVADGECWGRAVPEQSHAPRPHPPGGVRVQRQQRRQQQLPHPQPGQHLPGDKGEIVRHKSEAPTLLTQTRILS